MAGARRAHTIHGIGFRCRGIRSHLLLWLVRFSLPNLEKEQYGVLPVAASETQPLLLKGGDGAGSFATCCDKAEGEYKIPNTPEDQRGGVVLTSVEGSP